MPITFSFLETTFLSGYGEWTWGLTDSTGKRTWYATCSQQPVFSDIEAARTALYTQTGVKVSSQYATGSTLYCQKITMKAIAGDLTGLYAEAEYSLNQIEENPLLRKDAVSLEVAGETETWFLDANGKPTVTSAGEIFDKIPPRTTGGVKLIIEGNRSTLPAAAMVGLSRPHNVNGSALTVRGIALAAGQAKLTGCSGGEQKENGTTFYRVRWELTLAESWDLDIDDRGFWEIDATVTPNVMVPIYRNGEKVTKPWPLSDGEALPEADYVPDTLTFKPYPDGDLSVFGWTSAA